MRSHKIHAIVKVDTDLCDTNTHLLAAVINVSLLHFYKVKKHYTPPGSATLEILNQWQLVFEKKDPFVSLLAI